ncbi:uncharacterized protein, partial [Watersipora subatra]|uniref:uncharacterized protein n=1 Tax=Watersipora subatra TaxID=2589382 RepID=UPI00355BCF46
MLEAINQSKLPPPQPFTFDGDLLQYTDWKTSFIELVDKRPGGAAEKLALLKSYLCLDIQKQISGYCTLGTTDAYREALNMLDEQFGDPFLIGAAFGRKLENWPRIPNQDGAALRNYVAFLKQCVASMEKIHTLQDLNTVKEIKKIIERLPNYLERKWIRESTKYQKKHSKFPKLQDLCDFLRIEVKVACNPLNNLKHYDKPQTNSKTLLETKRPALPKRSHAYNIAASNSRPSLPIQTCQNRQTNPKPMYCGYCKKENHETKDCFHVGKLSVAEIEKFLTDNNLCFKCARGRHSSKQCRSHLECKVKGCKQAHATINHQRYTNKPTTNQNNALRNKPFANAITPDNHFTTNQQVKQTTNAILTEQKTAYQQQQRVEPKNQSTQLQPTVGPQGMPAIPGALPNTNPADTSKGVSGQCYSIRSMESNLSLMVMPVYVSYNGKEKLTYALVDSMSDSSYISEGLFRSLNIPQSAVKPKQLTLTTMNHISTDTRLAVQGLKLRGYGESYVVKLPTMITTPEKMEINKSYIPTAQRISSWSHLRDVAKKLPPELDLNVDILLGGDCNAVHLPLEVVASSPEQPHARRTVLGWTIMGSHHENSDKQVYSYKMLAKRVNSGAANSRCSVPFECNVEPEPQLPTPESIVRILEADFAVTREEPGLTIKNRHFITKLENEIKKDKRGYINMPLPFCTRPTGMGWKTKQMATCRLNMLLTMKSHVVLPSPGEFNDTDVYARKRWRQVQGLADAFWQRWRKEHIQSLQSRQIWIEKRTPPQVGDIVLLKDDAK